MYICCISIIRSCADKRIDLLIDVCTVCLFSYSRAQQQFVVSTCVLTHNHDIGPELFRLYPDQRRAAGDLAADIANTIAAHGKPKLTPVAEVLRRGDADLSKRKTVTDRFHSKHFVAFLCISTELDSHLSTKFCLKYES